MDDLFTTPEGFQLYKPLMFPDARRFDEILIAEKPWDFSTMNHRNGKAQPDTPEDIRRPGFTRVVSRFCSVRHMAGPHLMVTPTDQVLDAIFPAQGRGPFAFDQFTFFDRVGFEAIYHDHNDRVLIVASASAIIASRWVAYVHRDTMPVF